LPDVAVLGSNGALTTALNNGAGGWRNAQTVNLGLGTANGMVLGGFDSANPFDDLAVQDPNAILIYPGDGTGHFTLSQTLTPDAAGQLAPSGGGHVQMASAVLNTIFPALITVSPGTNEVLVYPGLGNGTFGAPDRYGSGGSQPVAVVV